MAAVALALPAGVAAYAVLAIARRLFGHLDPRLAVVATVAAIVVGVTGPNARAMLGTTMNEWTGTALTSVALLVVVRELHDDRARASRLVVAGLLAGIACGLKLTASVYALAIADRGYVLEAGQIVLSGSGAGLLADSSVREAYLGV